MDVLYTTTDTIRAVLGLTDRELYDKQITDLGVEDLVSIELSGIFPDHDTLKNAVENNSATPEELFLWKVLLQYVKYEAAAFLLPQFQMLVVQKISDGDAENSRFQNNNLQDTIERILTMRDKYRNMLLELLEATIERPVFSVFATVTPGYDPVTNEGAV